MNTDLILQKHFGLANIELGLERIHRLLSNLGNPHHKFPIIHIAGTNGKGSVCAYLSAILKQAGYRTGRYTSPHLIDWTERICINEKPISSADFEHYLLRVKEVIENEENPPTQFEIVTGAAWLYFAEKQVDIAVMEVGLGGRLDATNVCDKPLVSVITSIGWDHAEILGPTLGDIAREKAGILKPECPAVIGKLPTEATEVIEKRITELGCPVVWVEPAKKQEINNNNQTELAIYKGIEYSLPIAGDVQLQNSALAIESVLQLRQQGWNISDETITTGLEKTRWRGRIEWVEWQGKKLLIDGCHNADGAKVLRRYVDSLNIPSINWVVGMMERKDKIGIFKELLRPQDRLYLVPVPDAGTAKPEELATIAQNICPDLAECRIFDDWEAGLITALQNLETVTVLCGSLYLIGDFYRQIDNG